MQRVRWSSRYNEKQLLMQGHLCLVFATDHIYLWSIWLHYLYDLILIWIGMVVYSYTGVLILYCLQTASIVHDWKNTGYFWINLNFIIDIIQMKLAFFRANHFTTMVTYHIRYSHCQLYLYFQLEILTWLQSKKFFLHWNWLFHFQLWLQIDHYFLLRVIGKLFGQTEVYMPIKLKTYISWCSRWIMPFSATYVTV